MSLRIPKGGAYAAFVSSSVVKRLLERFYDTLAKHPEFQRLKALPHGSKVIAELALASLGSLLDANITETSAFRKFCKEILNDAPSELSRRMLTEASVIAKESAQHGESLTVTFMKLMRDIDDAGSEIANAIRSRRAQNRARRERK